MNKAEKVEIVESLKSTFSSRGAVILLSFKGIDVPSITDLRSKVRGLDSGYEVVKNTLAIRASEGTAVAGLKEYFSGPTAVAYTDDPVPLAKVLKEFVKANPGLQFKAGVLDGQVIDAQQVAGLADLPTREELLSKLMFLLNAPLTQLARSLISPVQKLAYGLNQLGEKRQGESGASGN
jgi:large subunit ribosomal protein L10